MGLNENDVNAYLKSFFRQYEDGFQEAWVEILEHDPQTIEDIKPIARKVRNRHLRQFLEKKYKENSLYKPLGKDGDGTFTLESILSSPTNEDDDEKGSRNDGIYEKMVDFLVREYWILRKEKTELKREELRLKVERLRVREETLKFKKDRHESWKKLMEEKGAQKDYQIFLKVELEREKLVFRKKQAMLKRKRADAKDCPGRSPITS